MIGQIFDNLYETSECILYNYTDKNSIDKYLDIEKNTYNILDFEILKALQISIEIYLEKIEMNNFENFEVVLDNIDEIIILKRILNQVNNKLYNYDMNKKPKPLYRDLYFFQNNNLIYIDNLGGTLTDIYHEIIANIEAKFILLLVENQQLNTSYKDGIIMNLMFIDPILEQKIKSENMNLNNVIKNEDQLYNSLYDYIKINYKKYQKRYANEMLKDIFYNLLTNENLSKNDLIINELYMRAIFNSLDEEYLKKLNYDFNNINLNIMNKDGENCIRRAFQIINSDKEMIKKIKTH